MSGEHSAAESPLGPLQDAHYVGRTAQDEPISFDVVGGGTGLTNLTFIIRASCSSGGRISFVGEPITITGLFPIGLDGHFGGTVAEPEIEAVIDGVVTTSASASGTLRVDLVIRRGDAKIQHSTGRVGWTARAG